MSTFKIIHHASSLVVNLYIDNQTGAVPNGTRISLYADLGTNDQKWDAETVDGYTLLRLTRDPKLVLNRNSLNNSTHVWTYDESEETKKDSLVMLENKDGYTRMKLVGHNLYLTKNANDHFLSWTDEAANERQYFIMDEVKYDTSERKTIDLPTDRICNWNQFYSTVMNTIHSPLGCAWACGLDVANIYGPQEYKPKSMKSTWDPECGYVWSLPVGCAAVFGYYVTYATQSEYLAAIRKEINHNRPVVVRMCTDESSRDTHFVVAYGYIDNGDTTLLIRVLDPAQRRNNTTTMTGRDVTLANALLWNGKDKISGLRPVVTNR